MYRNNDNCSMPYWRKQKNDFIDDEMYLYFDEIYAHWQIGKSMNDSDDVVMICMSDSKYPQQCEKWYDMEDGNELSNFLSFRVNECTKDDVFLKSCSAMHSWL